MYRHTQNTREGVYVLYCTVCMYLYVYLALRPTLWCPVQQYFLSCCYITVCHTWTTYVYVVYCIIQCTVYVCMCVQYANIIYNLSIYILMCFVCACIYICHEYTLEVRHPHFVLEKGCVLPFSYIRGRHYQ